jgi:hypothetical protein
MAIPAYSKRFVLHKALEERAIYVVNPGELIVVRCADIWAGHQFAVPHGRLLVSTGGAFWRWQPPEAIDIGGGFHAEWRGRQVLFEGEALEAVQEEGNADWMVSGYVLSA